MSTILRGFLVVAMLFPTGCAMRTADEPPVGSTSQAMSLAALKRGFLLARADQMEDAADDLRDLATALPLSAALPSHKAAVVYYGKLASTIDADAADLRANVAAAEDAELDAVAAQSDAQLATLQQQMEGKAKLEAMIDNVLKTASEGAVNIVDNLKDS